jgi:hypothetical protein
VINTWSEMDGVDKEEREAKEGDDGKAQGRRRGDNKRNVG